MANTVHPYKGYLNTEFRIHTNEVDPQKYSVIRQEDGTITKEGTASQNEYITMKMPCAGNYIVRFENTEIPINVEDGYKYGGNTHKKSFIFDECPWAFVIMHDRTYFHNRETKEEYVEAISPDEIIEVNRDFVFLSNNEEEGFTLYSCVLQRPILFMESFEYHDDTYLIWNKREETSKKNNVTIYSLSELIVLESIDCDDFFVDEKEKVLYTYNNDEICRFSLDHEITKSLVTIPRRLYFVTFIAPHHVVYSSNRAYERIKDNTINIYDLTTDKEIGQISYSGQYLARLNKKEIINLNKREEYLKKLDLIPYHDIEFNGNYVEFDIFPSNLDTFYVLTETIVSLNKDIYKKDRNDFSVSKERYFKSIEKEQNEQFDNPNSEIHVDYTDNYFCLYNSNESFVYNIYNRLYHEKGKVYTFNNSLYIKGDNKIFSLSHNGFWDTISKFTDGDYSLRLLNDFGVIIDNNTKECYLHLINLGKFCFNNDTYLTTDKYKIYKNGTRIGKDNCPDEISPNSRHGLRFIYNDTTKTREPYILIRNGSKWEETKILEPLYDTSVYENVLLSENGKEILYRTSGDAKMLNVETGVETSFPNESHIQQKHINGIRPLFKIIETTQARLINPIDGQPINDDMFSEYQFISPNGKLYADTELSKYKEYHNVISNEIFNNKEFQTFKKKFWHTLPIEFGWMGEDERPENKELIDKETERVFTNISSFIHSHKDSFSEYLKNKPEKLTIKEYLYKQRESFEKTWIISPMGALEQVIERFINSFIEVKYVALIRSTDNNKLVEKIYLTSSLQFINYVAFSQNNRFVAIAGKPGMGGLMQLYDLKEHKTIFSEDQKLAVWLVAFGKNGHLAGYTSKPNTIILKPDNNYGDSCKNPVKILEKSFLTFSPDGQFLACSEQGYIPYRNWDGTTNQNWGHQPSSIVSLRNVETPETEIIQFNDLSDQGIEDTHKARTVASVSFSQNNERIMMTGRNGVVIIRNLYL